MFWWMQMARSSIGAKLVMALTGILLFGFVIGHLAGNLQVFAGQEQLNTYAHFIHSKPMLLWLSRLLLLAVVGVHLLTALCLVRRNKEGRPTPYQVQHTEVATLASRSMMLTGLTVAAYVIYHLAHFTVGALHSGDFHRVDPQGRHDVYSMLVLGFQRPSVSILYLAAMLVLGIHLRHGISSFFQTLGLNHPRYNALLKLLGPLIATMIVVGYASIPIAVLSGAVALPAGAAR